MRFSLGGRLFRNAEDVAGTTARGRMSAHSRLQALKRASGKSAGRRPVCHGPVFRNHG